MLFFIQSNRLERLFDRLCFVLGDSGGNPLQAQEIVVQNSGMARWLSQQIALRTGIAANLHFPLPARYIWQIFSSQLEIKEDERSFDRSILLWRVFEQLAGSIHDQSFADIAGYLHDDHDGRKAYLLAGKIADLFDQYLVYRPDMVLEWESAPVADWQGILWKKMTASSRQHRAGYLHHFRKKVLNGELDPSSLPGQICVFGVSSLAPVYLEVLHAVSSVVDVHLFHLSPCREYWADLVSGRELANKRAGSQAANVPARDAYYDIGNPLLASLGKGGREFVGQVYELDMIEEEFFETPEAGSMLSWLQRDMLDLVDRSDPAVEKVVSLDDDHSVQLHSCHSRMREVQVLYDRLLEMFERDPDLKPAEILVMAPGIEEYASSVSSVFDGVRGDAFIPWSMADRSFRDEESLVDSFLSLFELCEGRCGAPDVISFLENGAVMRKFQIDEEGLATIRGWIVESGIRWGFNQEHRQKFGETMGPVHSWSFGMDRLLMGYFTGDHPELIHGISPSHTLSAGNGVILGRLAAFLDRLKQTSDELVDEKEPGRWVSLLLRILDDFYDPGSVEEDQQALSTLREVVCSLENDCRSAGFTGVIKRAVVRAWLNENLSGSGSGQAFLSGRVTFCNMVPLRSVPFKVVCLLGMNDTDFPRSQSRVGFDLMAKDPKTGDRNRRDDDRYLFLEALISARSVFYMSWIGRNQRDNSVRPPSVVVADLIDYLDRSFVNASGRSFEVFVVEHPLQPFSSKCFDGTPGTRSFAAHWLPEHAPACKPVFIKKALPEPAEEWRTVDMSQLVRFWSHPIRFFLQQRLDMQLRDNEDQLEDTEPFLPNSLESYKLTDRLLEARLLDQSAEKLYEQLQAEGTLPHGNFGRNYFRQLSENTDAFLPAVRSLTGEPRDPLEVDILTPPFRLKGWLTGLYAEGCVRYRPAKIKGRDLVKLWVEHLVYNARKHPGYTCRSVYVASDQMMKFRPVENPLDELQRLLEGYWRGLSTPLHFYPETSRAWFESREGSRASAAKKAWRGSYKWNGEGDDLEYRIALKGVPPLDTEFEQLSAAVFGPLYEHVENG